MITINSLTVAYNKLPVLDNLSLNLQTGCVHGLVGLNGSGKTTLLNTLYGFVKATKGNVLIDGEPATKKSIALLETQNYFYSNITGSEYLMLFEQSNQHFNLETAQLLFQLPLGELIENYSTGMKKKLALLAILKQDKPLIILDEPFNGLDLEAGNILKSLIPFLKEKGKTIIITSHILESLTTCCDYIHYLNNKHIERTFTANEFSTIHDVLFEHTQKQVQQFIANAF